MKLRYIVPTLVIAAASLAQAELKPGANLAPYEVHNTATGKEYCQMCAFSSKPATVAAYGKLNDAAFWADCEKLQTLANEHKEAGIFAQVLDSQDAAAIQAEAKKHGITFPVVYAKDKEWNDTYKVDGLSRVVYYSHNFKVAWSQVGLDEKSVAALSEKLSAAKS